jgi:serine phosphatase RsbU (regulator of sigma subunit)
MSHATFKDFLADRKKVDEIMAPVYEHGDGVMRWIVLGHAAVAMLLAGFYSTWGLSIIVTVAATMMFFMSVSVLPRNRVTRIISGIVLQTFVALHIYQLHGQPEMHFFFFTAFTAMIVYQDGLSMWPGTILIIMQHILFALLQNTGTELYFFPETVVTIRKLFFHFGIAIVQVVICNLWCHFVRRRTLLDAFQREQLDNVNESLEKQVEDRTAELQRTLGDLWSEMALAHKIQTVLLPPDGKYGEYEVSATMKPAEQVGGDYYDVFEHDEKVWVLIGDVSGHGVSAGLVMMMVQTAVRSVVMTASRQGKELSPARLLAAVNATVSHNLKRVGGGVYMTITALRLDGRRVQYAGLHDAPLVYRTQTQQVERLDSQGVWLGLVDDIGPLLEDRTFELAPEDMLVLYTDGLVEARKDNDDLLGLEPVTERLGQVGGTSAREAVDGLFHLLNDLQCNDDVTVLALRRAA